MYSFALYSTMGNQTWQLIPLYREIKRRGYPVDFYVDTEKLTTILPLNREGIEWESIELLDPDKSYDVIIENSYALSDLALKESGVSIGFFGGGAGSWLTISRTLPHLPLFNLWVGHNELERINRRKEGYFETFPVVGMPSLDNFSKEKKGEKIKGLYFNGPPFLPELKNGLIAFLEEFSDAYPDVEIIFKDRFIGKDESSHYELTELKHHPHIRVEDGSASPIELIEEADFLMGLATTAFIEALYLKKPVFILDDFDQEYYLGHRASETYAPYLAGMKRVSCEEMLKDFPTLLKQGSPLPDRLYQQFYPFEPVAPRFIDMAEAILEEGKGRSLKHLNFNLEYGPKFQDEAGQLIDDYQTNKLDYMVKKERQIARTALLGNALYRVRYVLPLLPNEVYQDFVKMLDEKEELLQDERLLQQTCDNMGNILYSFLHERGELNPDYLPPYQSLYEKGSDPVLTEALYLFEKLDKEGIFPHFFDRLDQDHPESLLTFEKLKNI